MDINSFGDYQSYSRLRKAAKESFTQLGIPTRQLEDWKYTDVSALNKFEYAESGGQPSTQTISEVVTRYAISKHYLVFLNGEHQESLSNCPDSVQIVKAQQTQEDDLVGSLLTSEKEHFVALNTAAFQDAAIITTSSSETLQIINISSYGVSPLRVFLSVESGTCNLIETYCGLEQSESNLVLSCPVLEYQIAAGAKLNIVKQVFEGEQTVHIANQEALIDADAEFNCYTLNLQAKTIRNNISAVLNEPGAFAGLYGVNLLNGQAHVDNHTLLDHAAPHCNSKEIYKSVLAEEAKSVFDGTIIVRQDAQKTNAIQSNQGLLLSDRAINYAKPQLKIWADDVKCTHGATCGALDGDAIFYLRSRGLSLNAARNILIKAFVGEVLSEISNTEIQEVAYSAVDGALENILSE